MPDSKLHVIFAALIISKISYALSVWGGFLNSQQINRMNAFFSGKLVDLVSAALHVYVMYQNI